MTERRLNPARHARKTLTPSRSEAPRVVAGRADREPHHTTRRGPHGAFTVTIVAAPATKVRRRP